MALEEEHLDGQLNKHRLYVINNQQMSQNLCSCWYWRWWYCVAPPLVECCSKVKNFLQCRLFNTADYCYSIKNTTFEWQGMKERRNESCLRGFFQKNFCCCCSSYGYFKVYFYNMPFLFLILLLLLLLFSFNIVGHCRSIVIDIGVYFYFLFSLTRYFFGYFRFFF